MPYLTFNEAKGSQELSDVSGVCGTGDKFKNYLNQATRVLMKRGNFWGTVSKLGVCVYNNCVTWPREVGSVLATNVCGHWVPNGNSWYNFLPLSTQDFGNRGFNFSGGCCRGNAEFVNSGQSPVFNNVSCNQNYYIRAYPQARADIGKTITIFGTDFNGQAIRTNQPDGTWTDGVVLTLDVPYVSTPFQVRHIERVIKDVTQNVVRLFQYDAINDVLLPCAEYQPTETSPAYRESRLQGVATNCSVNGGLKRIDALVKLEFIPVVADTDRVLIDDLDALAMMMQSIRYKNSGDAANAIEFEKMAIHELNLGLENKIPKDQLQIQIAAFGSAMPSRHGVGRII